LMHGANMKIVLLELRNTDCKWGTTVVPEGKSAPVPTQHVTVQVNFSL
jgi:hypothetical protein